MKKIPIPRRPAHWACALALLTGLAHAEARQPGATPSETPETGAFEGYAIWRDQPVADWREVNARVHAVGGWRTYLRESQGETAEDGAHAHHHSH